MSGYVPALIVLFCIVLGLKARINIFEHFYEGAKDGIIALWRILPTIIGMFVAMALVRNGILWGYIVDTIGLVLSPLGVSKELVPLALMRPFSGSASLAILTKLLGEHGPDSLIGLSASTFMASTETAFYVAATYLASVQIKKSRHIFIVALVVQFLVLIASSLIWRVLL